MRVFAIIIFVISIGVGGFTYQYLQQYLAEKDIQTAAAVAEAEKRVVEVPEAEVVVAAKTLPAGKVLEAKDLQWQSWPAGSLDDNYIVQKEDEESSAKDPKFDQFIDEPHIVRRGIDMGEPVTLTKVYKRGEAGFLSGMLAPGMRAVSIQINPVSAVAGFILPGDHVDVILTQQLRGQEGEGAARRSSEAILEAVRVLAIDQSVGDVDSEEAATATVGSTATVEVTPREVQVLAVAKTMGTLSLALRSLERGPADSDAGAFTSDLEISRALSGGTPTAGRRAEPTPRAAVREEPRYLVADRALPAGTLLRDSNLRWVSVPQGASIEDAFVEGRSDLGSLRGALLTVHLGEAEPVRSNQLMRPGAPGFLAAALGADMRAVNVDVSGTPMLLSLVSPGDRVDVVLTQRQGDGSGEGEAVGRGTSETILQNIRVLALDSEGGSATIEVSPQQAAELAVASTMGGISLAVRGTGQVARTAAAAATRGGAVRPSATRVLGASHDLSKGGLLRDSDLSWIPLPPGLPLEDYFVQGRDTRQPLRGALVERAVAEGEPLAREIVTKIDEPGFLAAAVTPGMRAVGIGVNAVTSAGGMITAGDKVDVVLTSAIDNRRFSETILRNVRVLSIRGNTATMELAPKQAEVLNVARAVGQLSLTLLSGEAAGPEKPSLPPFTSEEEVSQALRSSSEMRQGDATAAMPADPSATPAMPVGAARVIVAARDLDPGTLLKLSDLRFEDATNLDPAVKYFLEDEASIESLRGAALNRSVGAHQPVQTDAVTKPEDPGFLAATVGPGKRAVSIGLDAVAAVSGLISPGDTVDVVLSTAIDDRRFGETILQAVRVLSFDDENNTATLEVTPKQSEMLVVARGMGPLSLALRGLAPSGDDEYAGPFTSDLEVSRALGGGGVRGGEAGADQEKAAAPAVPVAPAAPIGTRLLVATRDLAAGTLLRSSDFRFEFIEGAAPAATYFVEGTANVETLGGALVTQVMATNELLTTAKLILPSEPGFLAAALRPGMRAVSLATDPVSAVSGFVSPGDRVDVLMTHDIDDTSDEPLLTPRRFSETIVRDIRILAIEQTVDESSGKPVVGNTATVEVTSKQAETIALGASIGTLSLALHSAAVAEALGPITPFTSDVEISDATTGMVYRSEAIYSRRQSPPPPAAAPTPTKTEDAAGGTPAAPPPLPPSGKAVKMYLAPNPLTLEF